ncbi:hypothetical protein [Aerococcus viridans]|uniref:hypothetical protein n=1 Tax=Aerococcus viridans TaxID=1377 RepID=UPI0002D3F26D|nr:hypothetical protein [Aerococcus viridans]
MDTIKIKKALVKAQMGDYTAMVKDIPYATFEKLNIPLQFDFKKIDEEVAAYIVANGYLEMFPSQMNQLNLLQKGNRFRLETGISSEMDDQFLANAWTKYEAIKRADLANTVKESMISRTGSQVSMWDKLIGQDIPELKTQQAALLAEFS